MCHLVPVVSFNFKGNDAFDDDAPCQAANHLATPS